MYDERSSLVTRAYGFIDFIGSISLQEPTYCNTRTTNYGIR